LLDIQQKWAKLHRPAASRTKKVPGIVKFDRDRTLRDVQKSETRKRKRKEKTKEGERKGER